MNVQIAAAYDRNHRTEYTEDGPVDVFEDVWFVVAEAEDGRRWSLLLNPTNHNMGVVAYANEADASEDARLATSPLVEPENWLELPPAYGSESWDEDAERELAYFEADAYGEPRPTW